MNKTNLTEFLIYEQLRTLQEYPTLNGAIHLHLDTYTKILDVFNSTNKHVRNLINELGRTSYSIKILSTIKKDVDHSTPRNKTEKIEMIITELVTNIQNDASLKKSISFHIKVYGQLLIFLQSTDKELMDKLDKLQYESFKANLDALYISNNR